MLSPLASSALPSKLGGQPANSSIRESIGMSKFSEPSNPLSPGYMGGPLQKGDTPSNAITGWEGRRKPR